MATLLIQSEFAPLSVELPSEIAMTEAQFYEFCRLNPELRIERTASGTVIIMSPAFSNTGHQNFRLAVQLGIWADQDGTGLGFDSSAGFTLPNGATRSPDAAWIRNERWNVLSDDEKASFAPICPDFVIELRSASDTLSSLQDKLQEYLDNGTRLGWLIDPKQHQVYVYRPGQPVEVLINPTSISGDPVLPGFVLDLTKIW